MEFFRLMMNLLAIVCIVLFVKNLFRSNNLKLVISILGAAICSHIASIL